MGNTTANSPRRGLNFDGATLGCAFFIVFALFRPTGLNTGFFRPIARWAIRAFFRPISPYGAQYGLLALAMAIAHTPAHFVCLERFDHELRDEFCIFDGVG